MKCKWISKHNSNKKCSEIADESGYCIFHKLHKTNKENEKMIQLIKERKIEDFMGFKFENKFYITQIIDYKYKELNFSEVIFYEDAIFDGYEFKENTLFTDSEFRKKVSFMYTKFKDNCSLFNTKFDESNINQKIFIGAIFEGQNFIANKAVNLPRMDGIKLDHYTKMIMIDVLYDKKHYNTGKVNYRIARNQATRIGDYDRIGYYYYKERAYGSRSMKKEDYSRYSDYLSSKFFDYLSRYVIGYGEKPWNVLIVSLITISIFAFLYMLVGVKSINGTSIVINTTNIYQYSIYEIITIYIDMWYFSMVTFSTLGYGDIVATTTFGKILVSLEVFFGVTIAAAWTSVIIKRMIR